MAAVKTKNKKKLVLKKKTGSPGSNGVKKGTAKAKKVVNKIGKSTGLAAKAKAARISKKPIKTYLTDRELAYFKELIMEQKTEILENARRLRESLVDHNTGEYVGDNSTFSVHMAEQGSDEMEREKNYMFVQRDEKYLGYLEDALEKIANKTYGLCVDCMAEPKNLCKTCPFIPKERLEVVPVTMHCLECKLEKSS
ncbi:MAG TPA: conjugal transfer protein TraR [Ignavibacteria bacterium]|jgi:RNA polymerase-binding transcription factor DksA